MSEVGRRPGRSRFLVAYVATWSVLALMALGYLVVALSSPETRAQFGLERHLPASSLADYDAALGQIERSVTKLGSRMDAMVQTHEAAARQDRAVAERVTALEKSVGEMRAEQRRAEIERRNALLAPDGAASPAGQRGGDGAPASVVASAPTPAASPAPAPTASVSAPTSPAISPSPSVAPTPVTTMPVRTVVPQPSVASAVTAIEPPAIPVPPVAQPSLPRILNAVPGPAETGSIVPRAGVEHKASTPAPVTASADPAATANAPPSFSAPKVKPAPKPTGLDLGSGVSIDSLRLVWALLAEQRVAGVERLQPRVISRQEGGQPSYRLVAGPLPSRAAAAKLCADIKAKGIACAPGTFEGSGLQ